MTSRPQGYGQKFCDDSSKPTLELNCLKNKSHIMSKITWRNLWTITNMESHTCGHTKNTQASVHIIDPSNERENSKSWYFFNLVSDGKTREKKLFNLSFFITRFLIENFPSKILLFNMKKKIRRRGRQRSKNSTDLIYFHICTKNILIQNKFSWWILPRKRSKCLLRNKVRNAKGKLSSYFKNCFFFNILLCQIFGAFI